MTAGRHLLPLLLLCACSEQAVLEVRVTFDTLSEDAAGEPVTAGYGMVMVRRDDGTTLDSFAPGVLLDASDLQTVNELSVVTEDASGGLRITTGVCQTPLCDGAADRLTFARTFILERPFFLGESTTWRQLVWLGDPDPTLEELVPVCLIEGCGISPDGLTYCDESGRHFCD